VIELPLPGRLPIGGCHHDPFELGEGWQWSWSSWSSSSLTSSAEPQAADPLSWSWSEGTAVDIDWWAGITLEGGEMNVVVVVVVAETGSLDFRFTGFVVFVLCACLMEVMTCRGDAIFTRSWRSRRAWVRTLGHCVCRLGERQHDRHAEGECEPTDEHRPFGAP